MREGNFDGLCDIGDNFLIIFVAIIGDTQGDMHIGAIGGQEGEILFLLESIECDEDGAQLRLIGRIIPIDPGFGDEVTKGESGEDAVNFFNLIFELTNFGEGIDLSEGIIFSGDEVEFDGEHAAQFIFDDFIGHSDGVIVHEDVVNLAIEADLGGSGEADDEEDDGGGDDDEAMTDDESGESVECFFEPAIGRAIRRGLICIGFSFFTVI